MSKPEETIALHKALDECLNLLDAACDAPELFFETELHVCQIDVVEFEKLEPRD